MKKILVPVDFSEASENAAVYAAEIAFRANASLMLFHVFHIPMVTTDVPMILPEWQEIEKEAMDKLDVLRAKLNTEVSSEIKIATKCKTGLATDQILDFANEQKPDLIVMGMQGAGYLSEKLIGSVTTGFLRYSKYPVLVINTEVKFKTPKRILLAYDNEPIEKQKVLQPLHSFAKLFHSKLYILNVVQEENHVPPVTEVVNNLQISRTLEDMNPEVFYTENSDTVEGINEFVDEHKMDMVVLIPRKHSWWENLIQEPVTKKIAFHTKVPILSLHE